MIRSSIVTISMIRLFIFILLTTTSSSLYSQSTVSTNSSEISNSHLSWSLYIVKSLHDNSSNRNEEKWSGFGLGVDLEYQFDSRIGIGGRMSFRNWGGINKVHLPLVFGPSYNLIKTSNSRIVLQSGIGPSLIIGTDYGSVFASLELGLRLERTIFANKSLILGTSFGQGMSFHPDHFEYLDVYIGVRF